MKKYFPNFTEFQKLSNVSNVVPVYAEIFADLETPVSAFLKLSGNEKYTYLLESVEGGERWGRYSFISCSPKLIFESKGPFFALYKPGSIPNFVPCARPMEKLKEIMARYKPAQISGLPIFWGGAVGYASYDMVRFIEELPNKPNDDLNLPDSVFLITDKMVIFDHLTHSVKIVVCASIDLTKKVKEVYDSALEDIEQLITLLKLPLTVKAEQKNTSIKNGKVKSNLTKAQFEDNVKKAKEHIKNGDIIQVVLSQRFSKQISAKPFDIYRALRLVNPSPYMYYLKLNDFEIIGSSPEILVRKDGALCEIRPIAGTTIRGKNEEEENMLAAQLLCDPKERAEHIMLVDLGRNDLGRVCKSASVNVGALMTIEKYSHVMHIVSSVSGQLKKGLDSFDLFNACFPAGTVSGAPKVRAMQIIDDLEPTARGPYAGAIGYFSFSGNMDMAITIRTVIVKNSVAMVQAGAGIVADSIPENEYLESQRKARALLVAIEKAEEGIR